MMNRLQSLFNRLAGVCDQTAFLQAEGALGSAYPSFSALQKPACWRRASRKQAPVPALRIK